MFYNRLWKRLAVFGCLAAVVGCSTSISSSAASGSESSEHQSGETKPKNIERDSANSSAVQSNSINEAAVGQAQGPQSSRYGVLRQSESIYQPALPELPEFTWEIIRKFNLPLNNPPHVPPAKAEFMRGDDIVLGVVLGDEARAYPWILMANYHAVNDHLNGEPIIVNLCEACNGGAAFLATLPDTVIDMRPRGLMKGTWYGIDFQTGSLWYPFIGVAFEGPLRGAKLTRIRAYFSSWSDWVREHPNSTVAVTTDEVRMREHGRAGRFADAAMFNPAYLDRIRNPAPNPNRDLLPGHTLVFGLIPEVGKKPRAFTVESLGEAESLIQITVNDMPLLLMLKNDYQIGAYQRVLNGEELHMKLRTRNPLMMTDQHGNKWNMWGRTTRGINHPSELPLVDGYMAKWYEWIENFPETELLEIE